ncbi:MAG: GTPase ObgE [Microcystis aeruginosa Ma_QC_Ch_20071001_S25]|jgi:GTP-binding protein|uniref:GTPase Obg n=2 Tax=Microcystis aeruginosa TaxID=1126 RepID=A0A552FU47_MICAE|nr:MULTISPECIES: GTPase ObgE [unclassified Microcystis]MCA2762771.1 GTPase ObgE [Microcystis sp. M151S2]MCA2925500.1 GTPase ObgE [Microcystis sp. M020S1]MCA2934351.1 GTPase ObgE [Microcystis sp. M015S1]NCR14086.1 GTPase ObgE [Microcystis aeruginosa SX13-11]NCR18208.1 GTPase ObgE [Microcystis aeruginosa LL13-03]NCR26840.1 GTPase ObgE [Microcystis aeruginosa LE13-04]NCR58577.1 GTPase ObgE [Microcystis aeruginosa LL13-06]NCR67861.1 GTPase ObgE [Microcystis aeruginosa LL11-07]NCR90452.1 GTPase
MQFIDRAEIEVEGGKGGDGIVAFRREKYVPAGGPAGGNGGKGGSVIFVATQNLQTLLDFQYSRYFKADDGKRGGPNNCTGANGSDRIIKVPCGTVVYDLDSEAIIGDLVTPEQTLIVAAGGKGGLGNRHFLSNNNRAPEYALPGLEGEKRHLRLELKLLAEVGLIGLPNAGKSTLISAVSSARPKIADYPFTTLIPNLGVVRKPTGDGTVFADIPGLIEGAHLGIGLGHEFLRHIERTRLLIHLVSLTSEDPIADYQIIQGELAAYGRGLEKRSQILVFNKIDAVDEETIDNYQKQFAKITNAEILTISAVTGAGLTTLLAKVWQQLEQLERVEVETPSLFS